MMSVTDQGTGQQRDPLRQQIEGLQSQPLESKWHRNAVRTLLGCRGSPQIVLQFGRANTAVATPRRRQTKMLVPPAAK